MGTHFIFFMLLIGLSAGLNGCGSHDDAPYAPAPSIKNQKNRPNPVPDQPIFRTNTSKSPQDRQDSAEIKILNPPTVLDSSHCNPSGDCSVEVQFFNGGKISARDIRFLCQPDRRFFSSCIFVSTTLNTNSLGLNQMAKVQFTLHRASVTPTSSAVATVFIQFTRYVNSKSIPIAGWSAVPVRLK